jgi:tetratricopeptide (TPR) repeat protein
MVLPRALKALLGVVLPLACGGVNARPFPATGALSPDIEEAVAAARASVEHAPNDAHVWLVAGMTFEGGDLLAQADACYRAALELGPTPQTWYRRSVMAWKLGELVEAVAAMRRALELVPDYAASHWRLGTYLFDQADFAGARAAFERSTQLDGQFVGAWAGLAQVFLAEERPAEALALLDSLRQRFPEHGFLVVLTKIALVDAGRRDEAERLRVAWSPLPPGNDPWQAELRPFLKRPLMDKARELLGTGSVGEAVRLLEQSLAEGSSDRNACAYLAWGYFLQGRAADARATLDSALKTDPTSALLLSILANVQEASHELEPALATCERILGVDPKNGALEVQRGRILTKLGRSEEAVAALRAALELDARVPELWGEFGLAQGALGHWAEAAPALERALRDKAKTSGLRAALAQAYLATARAREARDLLASAGRCRAKNRRCSSARAARVKRDEDARPVDRRRAAPRGVREGCFTEERRRAGRGPGLVHERGARARPRLRAQERLREALSLSRDRVRRRRTVRHGRRRRSRRIPGAVRRRP